MNGKRIDAPTRLAGGDSVKLGQSVLEIEAAAARPPRSQQPCPPLRPHRPRLPRLPAPAARLPSGARPEPVRRYAAPDGHRPHAAASRAASSCRCSLSWGAVVIATAVALVDLLRETTDRSLVSLQREDRGSRRAPRARRSRSARRAPCPSCACRAAGGARRRRTRAVLERARGHVVRLRLVQRRAWARWRTRRLPDGVLGGQAPETGSSSRRDRPQRSSCPRRRRRPAAARAA